jgi:isoleucyl-tRNA synthetase
MMAPILSFTAEEIWQVVGKAPDDSVMLHTWHALPDGSDEEALCARWATIREARADVQKTLEGLRSDGKIGASLQGEVRVRAAAARHDALASLGDDLRFVLITSAAELFRVEDEADEGIDAAPSEKTKCGRCWHFRDDVGTDADHPELCGRCHTNLLGEGERRIHA